MRISSVEEYGLRCLVALARQGIAGQISISDIAEAEGLSTAYVAKLLSILRRARLVRAVRGRHGGFCIARQPDQVTLLEVITALGGPLISPDHCSRFTGQMNQCVHTGNCSVHEILDSLAGNLSEWLAGTTLQDLIKHKRPDSSRPDQREGLTPIPVTVDGIGPTDVDSHRS
ncbi:MAG: Rrf2 family transcriptional regulator [bacterium]